MSPGTAMNVNLSGDLYDFVKAAVKSGRYASASEVVRVALCEKRDRALREVERRIEEGLESIRRGELLDGEVVIEELKERSSRGRTAGLGGK